MTDESQLAALPQMIHIHHNSPCTNQAGWTRGDCCLAWLQVWLKAERDSYYLGGSRRFSFILADVTLNKKTALQPCSAAASSPAQLESLS